MPVLALGNGEAHRAVGKLPRLRLRNMVIEADPSNGVDGLTRLQRPGLAPFASVGEGPIYTVWQQDGTFGGDNLVVSGFGLYRVNTAGAASLVGAVGGGRAQIAASADRAIVAIAGVAYSTDGASVVQVVMPDGVPVHSVAFLSGFFFLSVQGSQRIYYIQPGETDPGGLSFFEAERTPDAIAGMMAVGDELWVIGSAGEEVWGLTGDIDAPAQRFNARSYENGCIARDTLVNVSGALMWVTANFEIAKAQGVPQPISDPATVELLRRADPTTLRAWQFRLDGHVYYVLTSALDTIVYDLSTQQPSRFSSYGLEWWRAHTGANLIAGDAQSGKLWRLDTSRSNDDGENMVRELTGGVEIIAAAQRCNSLSMRVAAGWSPVAGFEPVVEICWSDDEGNSWSAWRQMSLGRQGQHRAPCVIRKLGLMRRPGRLFWLRMTDDATLRVSHVQYNEATA